MIAFVVFHPARSCSFISVVVGAEQRTIMMIILAKDVKRKGMMKIKCTKIKLKFSAILFLKYFKASTL